MIKAMGYAANHSFTRLKPLEFERAEAGAGEVEIDILFCGVCHSDLHTARAEWEGTQFPCVPGHEIVGRITAVGDNVTKLKVGDLAGVGCMSTVAAIVRPARRARSSSAKPPGWSAPITRLTR